MRSCIVPTVSLHSITVNHCLLQVERVAATATTTAAIHLHQNEKDMSILSEGMYLFHVISVCME